jgi:hypothetical protein
MNSRLDTLLIFNSPCGRRAAGGGRRAAGGLRPKLGTGRAPEFM